MILSIFKTDLCYALEIMPTEIIYQYKKKPSFTNGKKIIAELGKFNYHK